ncbi:MAG: A/G-specific adenine glycosylase [Chitinophagales bacterium]|nr:A/G-specific adenine glycosylase [Chitinophagales bacterium]
MRKNFSRILLGWYTENKRNLSFIGEKNPYYVWLREIILQQTRVEHGEEYYLRFIKKFPAIHLLANAKEDAVLKMWEGLGYYTRARNLHATAKIIRDQYNGKFPEKYDDILRLKGIGPYTAAAIAAYAFGLPYAAADANVKRILARIFGMRDPVNSPEAEKKILVLAQKLLDKNNPAVFNQAMMDFGAGVCKPVNPLCDVCPFQNVCYAFQNDLTDVLPLKLKQPKKKKRYFHFFVIHGRGGNKEKNTVIIHKRTMKDIWINMFQFPLIEEKRILSFQNIHKTAAYKQLFKKSKLILQSESKIFYQELTHQSIKAKFFLLEAEKMDIICPPGMFVTDQKKLTNYAFPGIVRESLKELQYF